MKKDIHFYEVGDEVDVFPNDDDIFEEFTGTIVDINLETGLLSIRDQDDDVWDAEANQLVLTYSEETESIH